MPGDPCFTAKSGLSESANCNDHMQSPFANFRNPESPINTSTSNAKYWAAANTDSAVPLLEAGNVEPKKYINANVVQLDSDGKQFLGATVSRLAPAAPQQLISLFKAAQELKSADKGNEPAEIVQFISPKAFHNPGKSKDEPISGLFNSGPIIEGVGQLISCKNSGESTGSSPPIRKFTVTYSDIAGKQQTLMLTEIAPDFRKSLMSAESIKDTVAQLPGKSSEGMLSKQGVGRVAIMHVALEVKRAIDQSNDPSSLNEEWVTQQVDEAIKKLEQHRPKYLSKNNDQKNHLITYLADVAKARASTTSKSDEPNVRTQTPPKSGESIPVEAKVKPQSPLGEKPIQPETQSVESSNEDGHVEVEPQPQSQPSIEVAEVTPAPVAPSAVNSKVESKPTFIENAEKLPFVNIGNSCYMNSALKFLMLTQGEALIQRIDSAAEHLKKQEQLVEDVSATLQSGSGRVDEARIEQAVNLVSLDIIMIETQDYKEAEALKRKAQATFVAPLREFVESYMKNTHHLQPSHESFKQKLSQAKLEPTLENEKDKLVECSEQIYKSVLRLYESKMASLESLADKLINHVSDLDCYKNEKFDTALCEYKNNFAVRCKAELKNILKGERLASQPQLELAGKVQKQLNPMAGEIAEKVKQLELLKKFFTEQPINSEALENKLRHVCKVFENVCFPKEDEGKQQDPIELFEKCQSVFGTPVFFEHGHCLDKDNQNKNQAQVEFYDLVSEPQTPSDFGGLLTEFDQTDLFDHDELYVAIRYQNKHQLFNSLNVDHRFKVQTRHGKDKYFQADSLIFHTGVETTGGHYFMIHRDKNNGWTRHSDRFVDPGLSSEELNLSSPHTSPRRPVMIRLKKV